MFMSTASTRWLARRPPSPRYTHFAAKSSPPMRKPAHSLGRCTTQIVTFKEGGPLLPSSFASSEASGVNPIIGRCRALLYPERNRRDEPFKPFFSAFCFLLSAFCFLLSALKLLLPPSAGPSTPESAFAFPAAPRARSQTIQCDSTLPFRICDKAALGNRESSPRPLAVSIRPAARSRSNAPAAQSTH